MRDEFILYALFYGKIDSYVNSYEIEALENFKTMMRFILAQSLGRLNPFKVPNLRKYLPMIKGILQSSPNPYVQFYE